LNQLPIFFVGKPSALLLHSISRVSPSARPGGGWPRIV
jgi:hypothetical protein